MLPLMLLMGHSPPPGTAVPVISDPVVTTGATGACAAINPGPGGVLTPASLRVSWTVTNPDAALYEVRVTKVVGLNTTIVDTQDTAASMHYDETQSGVVEDGTVNPFTVNWTYRVQLVRKNTNTTVGGFKESDTWTKRYGGCPSAAT